ncbi:MAG TPA: cache domain-containing protein, partial [Thermoanaerobaculia bacterium]|nr:cache domain-containing protein [Thermoanaerobaculia bacterium]
MSPAQQGQGTGPQESQWRRTLTAPALLRVLAIVVAVGAVFSVYLVTWVANREAYFTARNFRSLAGIGKQIESIIAVQGEALRHGELVKPVAKEPSEETAVRISYPDGASAPLTYRVRNPVRVPVATAGPVGSAGPAEPVLGFAAYPEGAYLESRGAGSSRRLALAPLIAPILARDAFDYVIVADGRGNVLFEKENREIRLASLAGLGAAGSAGGPAGSPNAANTAPGALGRQTTARIQGIDISGNRYDLFVNPLRLPVARAKADEGLSPWLVCGLVKSSRFRAESLALPRMPLVAFVALVGILLLGWPLLKLGSMDPWEHLSRLDLIWLGTSLYCLPALLALGLWGGWHLYGLQHLVDDDLRGLAARIDDNLAREIAAYEGLLADVDRSAGPAVDRLARNPAPSPAELAPDGLPRSLAPTLSRLPFANVYWVRRDGCQLYKIDFGSPSNLVDVRDREYFRAVTRGIRLEPRAAAVESIHSWTTGEPELVVAVGRRDPEVPVVAVATPLVSLIDPVLPRGFGYAVVASRALAQGGLANPQGIELGDVLLHSDKRRNLRENFLQETPDDLWLGATLAARESALDTVVYQGQFRRVYTRPLAAGGRPWSVVVFADSSLLTDFSLKVVADAAFSVLLYGLALGLLALLYSRAFGGRGSDWLWPQGGKLRVYPVLAGILLSLTLLGLHLRAGDRAGVPLFVALVPVVVLLALHEGLGRPGSLPSWRLRGAAAAVTLAGTGLAAFRVLDGAAPFSLWLLAAAAAGLLAASAPGLTRPARGSAALLPAEKRARGWQVLCFTLLSFLVGALPAATFFDAAFAGQLKRLLRSGQDDVAGQLEERRARLGREISEALPGGEAAAGQAPVAAPRAEEGSCKGVGVAFPPPPPAGLGAPAAAMLSGRLAFERSYQYGSFFFDTCVCHPAAGAGPATLASLRQDCFCRESEAPGAPRRNWDCPGSGRARRQAAPLSGWREWGANDAGTICFEREGNLGGASGDRVAVVTRVSQDRLVPTTLSERLLFGFVAACAVAGVALVLRAITGLLFFPPGARPGVPAAGEEPEEPIHLALERRDLPRLGPPPRSWGWALVDLRAERDALLGLGEDVEVIVVDHFDQAGEAAERARRSLLQIVGDRRLVLLCDGPPTAVLPGPPETTAEASAAPAVVRDGEGLRFASRAELADRLARDPYLSDDGERLELWLARQEGANLRRDLGLVGAALRPVYEARWAALERGAGGSKAVQEHKLMLRALVRQKWLTRKANRHLDRLAAWGMVTLDPRPRIVP